MDEMAFQGGKDRSGSGVSEAMISSCWVPPTQVPQGTVRPVGFWAASMGIDSQLSTLDSHPAPGS